MTAVTNSLKLIFEGGWDERAAFEAEARGYRSHVCVEFPNGTRYPVLFSDPVRLGQDLEEMTKRGEPFISDPGLIVVSRVTLEIMQIAVERLYAGGFFEHFRPLSAG
jgi:hypothetical protein